MSLRDIILQIKKWVSLIEKFFKKISLFFKEKEYSKIEEEVVNFECISYIFKGSDGKNLELTFSQVGDYKEEKTICFDDILNKINNNVDQLLDSKVLDEFINYAEEKLLKEKDQKYQRMSKDTIQNILTSFKLLNKFIIKFILTIFDMALYKDRVGPKQFDNMYIRIKQGFEKNKERYLNYFNKNKAYIGVLLTNYEEFSLHKEAMVIEKLYATLKCTEKFEAVTPQRKPLKRKKIERRNTICDDTYKISCSLIYVKDRYSVWPMSPPQKKTERTV